MTWRVPLARPDLTGNESRYLAQAVDSSWISSSGAFVDRFEREFAQVCDVGHALGVSNGTCGLHLVLAALNVGPGDEVIVPSLTFIATANAVHYLGGQPVFVDVDPQTWCVDVSAVAAAITPRTVGVIAVHLYGHPADMDALSTLTAAKGLFLIEDAAEAHGSQVSGRPVGGLATAAVFSFYGNKIVTCGEGGAVTTSDTALAARMRLLRGQGMDSERRYFFPVVGYNYRLTNLACAILCAQLERLDAMLAARRAIDAQYREGLGAVTGICLQPEAPWARSVPWLVSIVVDETEYGMDRDALANALAAVGIETRPFFIPIHSLPPYAEASAGLELPVTVRLADRGLNLPTFSGLGRAEVALVVDSIARAARSPRRNR